MQPATGGSRCDLVRMASIWQREERRNDMAGRHLPLAFGTLQPASCFIRSNHSAVGTNTATRFPPIASQLRSLSRMAVFVCLMWQRVARSERFRDWERNSQRVTNVEFHPTASLLAIGRSDRVEILSLPNYQLIDECTVEKCQRIGWRPYFRELAITSSGSIVVRRADHIKQNEWSTIRLPKTLIDGPTNAFYDPTGNVLAVSAWDGHTHLIDPDTGHLLLETDGHAISFSRSGKHLAFGVVGERAGRWRFTIPKAFQQVATPVRSDSGSDFDFSPDGRLIVSLSPTGTFVWDTALRRPVDGFQLGTALHSLVVNGEDLLLADARSASLFRLSRSGDSVWAIGEPRPFSLPPTMQPMQRMVMTSKGTAFATFSDRAAILSPPYDEHSIQELTLKNVWRPAISPDAKYIAFSYYHGTKEYIAELSTRKIVHTVDGSYGRASFSRDGKWLAIGFAGKTTLCETETWTERSLVREFTGQQSAMPAFSPDGRILAVANAKSSIQLVDVRSASLDVLANLVSPARPAIEGMRFSPSGRRLVVSASSNLLQVWDLGMLASYLRALGLESKFADEVSLESKQPLSGVKIRLRP